MTGVVMTSATGVVAGSSPWATTRRNTDPAVRAIKTVHRTEGLGTALAGSLRLDLPGSELHLLQVDLTSQARRSLPAGVRHARRAAGDFHRGRTMIELEPLSSSNFNATAPHAINDAGQVVGRSFVYRRIPLGPYSTATLWENAIPVALTTSANWSEALRINNQEEILLVQLDRPYYDPINPTYFLRTQGTTLDLNSLVPRLRGAVDLNDGGLILGVLDSADPGHTGVVYDVRTNTLSQLPPLIVNGTAVATAPIGIDNAGRVAVMSAVALPGGDIFWLPPGGATWNNSGITRIETWSAPSLSKSGLLLATVALPKTGVGFQSGRACYLDLNDPGAAVMYLPRMLPIPTAWELPMPWDASGSGRIVGHIIGDGLDGPLLYDVARDDFFQPALAPTWAADRAVGINGSGAITGDGGKNYGTPAYQKRGWVVEWPPVQPRVPLLTWLRLFGGVIQDAGGTGLTAGGKPVPIDPWGSPVPPEKRDILTVLALGEFASLLTDPELQQIVKRAETELLEKAMQNMTGRRG